MKNNKVLTVSLISAGLIMGGIGVKSYKDKKDRDFTVRKMQHETDSLGVQNNQYDARRDFYLSAVAENIQSNPDADNMKKLFDLVRKLDNSVWQKYDIIERDFIQKCRVTVQCNLGKKKSYYIPQTNEKITPYFVEDWMQIIYANSKKIPNIGVLNKEYKKIMALRSFIDEFNWFIGSEFAVYLPDTQNCCVKTKILPEAGHLIDDKICRYNNSDNIKQNKIISDLFQQYLDKFIECGENKMPLLDKKLYDQVHDLASVIVEHNDIEAAAISYDKAVKNLDKQILYNQFVITNLQQKNY